MSPSTVGKFELRRWVCIGGREDRVGMPREGGSAENANSWTDVPSEAAKKRMGSKWRSTHLSDDILPALRRAGVKEDQIDQMLVRNPRAIFEARNA